MKNCSPAIFGEQFREHAECLLCNKKIVTKKCKLTRTKNIQIHFFGFYFFLEVYVREKFLKLFNKQKKNNYYLITKMQLYANWLTSWWSAFEIWMKMSIHSTKFAGHLFWFFWVYPISKKTSSIVENMISPLRFTIRSKRIGASILL